MIIPLALKLINMPQASDGFCHLILKLKYKICTCGPFFQDIISLKQYERCDVFFTFQLVHGCNKCTLSLPENR